MAEDTNFPYAFSHTFSSFLKSSMLNRKCWWTIIFRKWDLFNVDQIQIQLKQYFVNYCTFYILAVLGTNWVEKNTCGIAMHKNCGAVTPNALTNLYHLALAFLCSHDSDFSHTNKMNKQTNNSFEFCVEALIRISFSIIAKPNFLHCHFDWIKVSNTYSSSCTNFNENLTFLKSTPSLSN